MIKGSEMKFSRAVEAGFADPGIKMGSLCYSPDIESYLEFFNDDGSRTECSTLHFGIKTAYPADTQIKRVNIEVVCIRTRVTDMRTKMKPIITMITST